MKKLLYLTIIITISALALVGCNDSSVNFEEFSNGEVVFTYPSDWKAVNYKKNADLAVYIEAFFTAPMKFGDFQPNVNLTVHNFSSATPTITDLIKSAGETFSLKGGELGFEDYKEIKTELMDLQNIKAGLLIGEYTISKSKVRMKTAQLIVPLENKVYNLTVTSELSQWPSYEAEFTAIIDSFKLQNGDPSLSI